MAEPVRIVRNLHKINNFTDNDECRTRSSSACRRSSRSTGINTPLTPGTKIEYEMPDMYGRPWAKIWDEYFEQGMSKPESPRTCSTSSETRARAAASRAIQGGCMATKSRNRVSERCGGCDRDCDRSAGSGAAKPADRLQERRARRTGDGGRRHVAGDRRHLPRGPEQPRATNHAEDVRRLGAAR